MARAGPATFKAWRLLPMLYLGWTPGGGGRPVRYDVTAPSREARTSAVLLAGTLGSGKTVAAQAIALGGERRGSLVVDFDPKPDHGFDQLPQLEGRVEVLELSGAQEHRGKLDPLAVGLEDLREELASSYYLDLLREPPPSWENAIQRAVREVVRRRGRSSLEVIEQLKTMDADAAHEAPAAAPDGHTAPREDGQHTLRDPTRRDRPDRDRRGRPRPLASA